MARGGRFGGGHMGGGFRGPSHMGGGFRSAPRMNSGFRSAPHMRSTFHGPIGGPIHRGPRRGLIGGLAGGLIGIIALPIVIISVAFSMIFSSSSSGYTYTSDYSKLENVPPYSYNNVVDEANWIKDTDQLAMDLKYFYDKTGIQPYVYITTQDLESFDYDEDKIVDMLDHEFLLKTSAENDFVFCYFATDDNKDFSDGYYYAYYAMGYDTEDIMYSNGNVSILYDNIESAWYENDVGYGLANGFKYAADDIMSGAVYVEDYEEEPVSTTSFSTVFKNIIGGVIGVGSIYYLFSKLFKKKKDEEVTEYSDTLVNNDYYNTTDDETSYSDYYNTNYEDQNQTRNY